MNLFDDLIRRTGTFCRWGVLLTGVFYILVSFAVAQEVVLRKIFNVSMMGIDEMSGFVLAIGTSWGFAFALLHRAHIRIDTVLLVLPQRARAVLDILGLILIVRFRRHSHLVRQGPPDPFGRAGVQRAAGRFSALDPAGAVGHRVRHLLGPGGSSSAPRPDRFLRRRPGEAACSDRVTLGDGRGGSGKTGGGALPGGAALITLTMAMLLGLMALTIPSSRCSASSA